MQPRSTPKVSRGEPSSQNPGRWKAAIKRYPACQHARRRSITPCKSPASCESFIMRIYGHAWPKQVGRDADLYQDLRRQITMLFWFGAPFEHQVDDEHSYKHELLPILLSSLLILHILGLLPPSGIQHPWSASQPPLHFTRHHLSSSHLCSGQKSSNMGGCDIQAREFSAYATNDGGNQWWYSCIAFQPPLFWRECMSTGDYTTCFLSRECNGFPINI